MPPIKKIVLVVGLTLIILSGIAVLSYNWGFSEANLLLRQELRSEVR